MSSWRGCASLPTAPATYAASARRTRPGRATDAKATTRHCGSCSCSCNAVARPLASPASTSSTVTSGCSRCASATTSGSLSGTPATTSMSSWADSRAAKAPRTRLCSMTSNTRIISAAGHCDSPAAAVCGCCPPRSTGCSLRLSSLETKFPQSSCTATKRMHPDPFPRAPALWMTNGEMSSVFT